MKGLLPKPTLLELDEYNINQRIVEALTSVCSHGVLFSIVDDAKLAVKISKELQLSLSAVYKTLVQLEKLALVAIEKFEFSNEGKKIFLEKEFIVSKLTDRMGMRLEGPKIENVIDTNIKSEGLIKGVIQVPADGNPIVMLSDHGTIGGYPKIGVVISADYDKLVQLSPGSKIKFKQVDLSSAENLFKLYDLETQNLISQIE